MIERSSTPRPMGVGFANRLSRRIFDTPQRLVVIDSARIAGQIEGLGSVKRLAAARSVTST